MFEVKAEVQKPGQVEITLTMTERLEIWEQIAKDLENKPTWAGEDLSRKIRDVVYMLKATVRGE